MTFLKVRNIFNFFNIEVYFTYLVYLNLLIIIWPLHLKDFLVVNFQSDMSSGLLQNILRHIVNVYLCSEVY